MWNTAYVPRTYQEIRAKEATRRTQLWLAKGAMGAQKRVRGGRRDQGDVSAANRGTTREETPLYGVQMATIAKALDHKDSDGGVTQGGRSN